MCHQELWHQKMCHQGLEFREFSCGWTWEWRSTRSRRSIQPLWPFQGNRYAVPWVTWRFPVQPHRNAAIHHLRGSIVPENADGQLAVLMPLPRCQYKYQWTRSTCGLPTYIWAALRLKGRNWERENHADQGYHVENPCLRNRDSGHLWKPNIRACPIPWSPSYTGLEISLSSRLWQHTNVNE